MSKITFSEDAWDEYLAWQEQDKKGARKVNALLKDIGRHPFSGLGKPEPLKNRVNAWSRRINDKDRLIYEIAPNVIYVSQCKGHYDDK